MARAASFFSPSTPHNDSYQQAPPSSLPARPAGVGPALRRARDGAAGAGADPAPDCRTDADRSPGARHARAAKRHRPGDRLRRHPRRHRHQDRHPNQRNPASDFGGDRRPDRRHRRPHAAGCAGLCRRRLGRAGFLWRAEHGVVHDSWFRSAAVCRRHPARWDEVPAQRLQRRPGNLRSGTGGSAERRLVAAVRHRCAGRRHQHRQQAPVGRHAEGTRFDAGQQPTPPIDGRLWRRTGRRRRLDLSPDRPGAQRRQRGRLRLQRPHLSGAGAELEALGRHLADAAQQLSAQQSDRQRQSADSAAVAAPSSTIPTP